MPFLAGLLEELFIEGLFFCCRAANLDRLNCIYGTDDNVLWLSWAFAGEEHF